MLRGFFGNLIFANFCHYCSNVVRKSSEQIFLIPFLQRERRADYEVKHIAGYFSQLIGPTKKKLKKHSTPDECETAGEQVLRGPTPT